ncbi:MAG: hypothetical protein GY895_22475 [Phycisphaera sp.]|nr:hypothetical protein [Phycisphaera sp.]
MTTIGLITILFLTLMALASGVFLVWVMVKVGAGVFQVIGAVMARILEFIGGQIGDSARIIGAIVACLVMIPLSLLNVVIGRWSAANHYAEASRREVTILGGHLWSLAIRRPLRLLFLESMLEGVEGRTVEAVRGAPGPDRPRGGVTFPGFEVVGSLPSGGSGAKLYIARPDERTRNRLRGMPGEVVIKSFAMADGSSLPQIVRESRSLESAKRLGLVLAHELDETTFWYAMPYHPGDHLGIAVREAHAADFEDGLRGDRLDEMLGYAMDLVRTLDRYHREGLWHKDVKPDNIIIHDGAAHLVDFGLVTSLRSAMTLTTHGTEYFRDPEMVRMAMRGVKVHEVNGAKFDVYGAGAVLYFMLENTFPGHGGLSRFERPAPEALRWVVRRAMADYGQRYESTSVMLADLEAVSRASDPWSVTPAMLPSMREGAEVDLDAEKAAGAGGGTPRSSMSTPPPPPPPPPPARSSKRRLPTRLGVAGTHGHGGWERPASEQIRSAKKRAADRRRSARKKHSHVGISRPLVGIAIVFILAFASAISVIVFLGVVEGGEDGVAVQQRGPLALARGWENTLVEGEIPRPTDSTRLVMLESHHELRGTHADEAIRGLRSALEERGWEIVEDPTVLAESIVGMPGGGISHLDADQLDNALDSLEQIEIKHEVDTVLFVRTQGDDGGGVMEVEFWKDGVGRITSIPLSPETESESMKDIEESAFADEASRIMRDIGLEVLDEIEDRADEVLSVKTTVVQVGPARIDISFEDPAVHDN